MVEMNSFDDNIGMRIKLAREKAGITQEQLAEEINKSLSFISMLEQGRWLFWHRCGSITSTFPYADREKPPLRILRFGNGIFRSEQYRMTM